MISFSRCHLISLMNNMMNIVVWDDDSKQYETHGGIYFKRAYYCILKKQKYKLIVYD